MGKCKIYFLAARNRRNNTVKFISISGDWGDLLEDIDLFTTNFDSQKKLAEYLYNSNKIDNDDVDLFIVNRGKNKDNSDMNIQEILYSDSKDIKKIASSSKKKRISESFRECDSILNRFCYQMENYPDFNDLVTYGDTNVYDKFVEYFINSKYDDNYDLKYKDGGWARKSYYLIRNICEAFSRYSKGKFNDDDKLSRSKVRSELIKMSAVDYDQNQLSFFDFDYNSDRFSDDKLLEVMEVFDVMDDDVVIDVDGVIGINEDKFEIKDSSDRERFINLLDKNILSVLFSYKSYLREIDKIDFNQDYKDYYDDLINNCRKSILSEFEDTSVLDNAYSWCLLYNEYNDKRLGDIHEYRYKKQEN